MTKEEELAMTNILLDGRDKKAKLEALKQLSDAELEAHKNQLITEINLKK